MKKTELLLVAILMMMSITSCTVTIPMQSNLSDQLMLMGENRNIYPNISLTSDQADGPINLVSAQKNGHETVSNSYYQYASETAFKNLWNSYFSAKFNSYSKDTINIKVHLKSLVLKQQLTTSIGGTMFTGNSKYNNEAAAVVQVSILYHGENYETQFQVVASGYNESQMNSYGNTYYTTNAANPTGQMAQILESALNKSIIHFENYLESVVTADQE
ncbi:MULTISPECIES: hypothetical protein [unclassified Lentimicrobium]|uniref:hypothetical protein n=1 Tax=unclassified Lentimicrobium TaxID=2677434 RepID=UPI0015578F1E|nr:MULTISPECIES: hypothetical protein [unclassified Lentimicrobium]NPD47576.1 hypothetical protein [Lentimicrobium sp. S6]NPD86917.1 hypothetical protein [Lentimicrobium sp. L6]